MEFVYSVIGAVLNTAIIILIAIDIFMLKIRVIKIEHEIKGNTKVKDTS